MKVILVMVQSVNGKITRGVESDIYAWTSREDADFFFSLLRQSSLIVMGSGTYEAVKDKIKPTPDQLRIVLTNNPERYKRSQIEDQLEFRNASPKVLVDELEKKGRETLLLVGGGDLNKSFIEADLVDELYLTIEPRLFGQGKTVVAEGRFEKKLTLLSSKTLNSQGSLLLHYSLRE